ncbi:MAG: putative effector of murein hydrolase LrgA (UPF0299 family) [Candidatus Omnitrophota bacterium]|jgi:putative effector of murein hydrolase LrgA (UPF0299 family)
MELKTFLVINACLFVPFGVAMLAVPGLLFPLFGLGLDGDGQLMGRIVGASLLCLGLISYWMRAEAVTPAVRTFLLGSMVFHFIDAGTTFVGAFTQVMNPLGWMFSSMHFVLAIGFALYLWPLGRGEPNLGSEG